MGDAWLELEESPAGSTDAFRLRDCEVDPITLESIDPSRVIRVRLHGRGLACYDVESLYTALQVRNSEPTTRGVFSVAQLARITGRMRELYPDRYIAPLGEAERRAAEAGDRAGRMQRQFERLDPELQARITQLTTWVNQREGTAMRPWDTLAVYWNSVRGEMHDFEDAYEAMERERRPRLQFERLDPELQDRITQFTTWTNRRHHWFNQPWDTLMVYWNRRRGEVDRADFDGDYENEEAIHRLTAVLATARGVSEESLWDAFVGGDDVRGELERSVRAMGRRRGSSRRRRS